VGVGCTTTACNAFNIGPKGTWFRDNNHDYFFSLTGEILTNIPLPTYLNKNTGLNHSRRLTDEEIFSMNIQPNMVCTIQNDSSSLGRLTHQEVKDALQYLDNQFRHHQQTEPLSNSSRSWFSCRII